MKCPQCRLENREGAKFCKKCGAKLELVCPKCSTLLTPDCLFCDECGSKVSKLLERAPKDLSLDEMISDDYDSTLMDFIPDDKAPRPDDTLMDESLKIEVEKVLMSLPHREGEILRLYYGITGERSLTLSEIGDRLNLCRERVRQIKELSLKKLQRTSKGRMLRQFLG